MLQLACQYLSAASKVSQANQVKRGSSFSSVAVSGTLATWSACSPPLASSHPGTAPVPFTKRLERQHFNNFLIESTAVVSVAKITQKCIIMQKQSVYGMKMSNDSRRRVAVT